MIRKMAFKNLIYKPLNTILCLLLLTFSVSIISLIIILQHDIESKFQNDLRDIDLIMGAKGSPLQLVLSAIYHLDVPTGNINLGEAKKIMDSNIVKQAIPLAYGDSYKGYRILGTERSYIEKYEAALESGKTFENDMEAVLGSHVAKVSGLKIGHTFTGTHGDIEQGHVHENHKYTVVGILKSNHSVIDNLVLTNIASVWKVHDNHPQEDRDHIANHAYHDEDEKSLHHEHGDDHLSEDSHDHQTEEIDTDKKEITAVLMNFKSKRALFNLPRTINEQTSMQAVIPSMEINRLFSLIGIGASTLYMIAGGIMVISGLSIFFILYNRMEERKYELAILRAVGYRPIHLLYLLLLEGIFLANTGYFLGLVLSRSGLYFINQKASTEFHLTFSAHYRHGELWIYILTLAVGIIATIIPALRAMKMNVSSVLAEN